MAANKSCYMYRNFIYSIILILTGLTIPRLSHAQPCPQFPAACPDLRSDPGSAGDSISRLGSPVLPCEVAMENRLRNWAAALVNNIASKEKWDVTEIYEALGGGYRDENDAVLVYERRPAHWARMVWQFVVDKDSLQAWRGWLEDLSRRRLDQAGRSLARINSRQGTTQAYMDSANYWGGLMAKYMTDHIAQYQKDLAAGNKTGVNVYEKGVDAYRNKQDYFINKATDLQKDPQGEKDNADREKEFNVQKLRFHEACVVVIEFDFNNRLVETAGGKRTASPGGSPPAAKWYAIPQPDLLDAVNYYTHSHNMALWMVGSWAPQPDTYGNYNAVWAADKSNWRTVTAKKIKSDKIQNLFIRISGNAAAMRRILADLPAEEFERLITRP